MEQTQLNSLDTDKELSPSPSGGAQQTQTNFEQLEPMRRNTTNNPLQLFKLILSSLSAIVWNLEELENALLLLKRKAICHRVNGDQVKTNWFGGVVIPCVWFASGVWLSDPKMADIASCPTQGQTGTTNKQLHALLFRWFEPYIVHCMVVKITCRHQEAKCVNTSLKVFYLFDSSHVWFFHSLSGCSWCMKCQKNKFLFLIQQNSACGLVGFGFYFHKHEQSNTFPVWNTG